MPVQRTMAAYYRREHPKACLIVDLQFFLSFLQLFLSDSNLSCRYSKLMFSFLLEVILVVIEIKTINNNRVDYLKYS